jgi:predicted nucleic acid-binding protein
MPASLPWPWPTTVRTVTLLAHACAGNVWRHQSSSTSKLRPSYDGGYSGAVWTAGELSSRSRTWPSSPCSVHPTPRCSGAAGELRENLTIYDAAYVALAEVLQAALLTGG